MIKLRARTEVDAPAGRVWELLGDYRADPAWRAGVATMAPSPPGPIEPGQTTDEHLRFAGRSYRNGGLVEAVGPGRTLTWRTTSGVRANGRRTVEELPGGRSRVALETDIHPDGVDRLLAPVLGRVLRRRLGADLRRLRELAERGPARGGGGAR
ncbi:SRPBCC family protein [Pseudonocardia lacus]|uniref:SRPBCC family protein n=1 Tax=Pseudonocardia lacus TaxID=2835865 RepID=UPI001BDC4992|nr:SRPBCC family protein [Pseudonocardia lacus]